MELPIFRERRSKADLLQTLRAERAKLDAPPDPFLWPLWRWIMDQSWDHYIDHVPDLEAWVAQP